MRSCAKNIGLFSFLLILSFSIQAQGASRFRETAKGLDQIVEKADLKVILPQLAQILKMDAAIVRKAMLDDHHKLSTLALAHLIEEKGGESASSLLQSAKELPWVTLLTAVGISDQVADEYLDSVYAEVAFLMLDHRGKRKR